MVGYNTYHHPPSTPLIVLPEMDKSLTYVDPAPLGISAYGFPAFYHSGLDEVHAVHVSSQLPQALPPPAIATAAAAQGPEDGYHEHIRVLSPPANLAVGFDPVSRRSSLAVKDTPLAKYTAMTFWYLWNLDFGRKSTSVSNIPNSPLHDSPLAFLDDIPLPNSLPQDDRRFAPNFLFGTFVSNVLTSTQVSHSVVVLALIYTHRYKQAKARGISAQNDTLESQAFITALMLANKYLDDNTYTNATWAGFLSMPVAEVNAYELKWLDLFKFDLNVSVEQFGYWNSMLDAHIGNQQRKEEDHVRALQQLYIHSPYRSRVDYGYSLPRSTSFRARSVSPPTTVPSHINLRPSTPEDPLYVRKRTAFDVFPDQHEVQQPSPYDRSRMGHKTTLSGDMTASHHGPYEGHHPFTPAISDFQLQTPPDVPAPMFASGQNASSSLRPIAKLPGSRRGSTGHVYGGAAAAYEPDLRHTATNNAAWVAHPQAMAVDYVPRSPDRLYFNQAAATPYGQDGGFRKAIPHYFDRHPAAARAMATADPALNNNQRTSLSHTSPEKTLFAPSYSLGGVSPTNSISATSTLRTTPTLSAYASPATVTMAANQRLNPHSAYHLQPQPAAFANAGPPGYVYGQPAWTSVAHHAAPVPTTATAPGTGMMSAYSYPSKPQSVGYGTVGSLGQSLSRNETGVSKSPPHVTEGWCYCKSCSGYQTQQTQQQVQWPNTSLPPMKTGCNAFKFPPRVPYV